MKKQLNNRQSNSPFTTIALFAQQNPVFSEGSIKWLIFHKRTELIEEKVIRYWGKKILIHEENFYDFILKGGTEKLS
tara:strand:+ start:3853 stop:4083 length:231 start_codon:yes stop_codon:yes gene_type:complete